MIAKQKKNKRDSHQTLIFSIILGTLFVLVVGFLVVADWRINQKRAELNSRLKELQQELQSLEGQKAQLQAQVSQAADEGYLEQEAREKFNLKKPGEEVVTVLPVEAEEKAVEAEAGFWQKILEKIKFW